MTNYRRGRNLEYVITDLFKKNGWSVIRGAGSKGTVDGMKADVIASKRGVKYDDKIYMVLIQAKRVSHGKNKKSADSDAVVARKRHNAHSGQDQVTGEAA